MSAPPSNLDSILAITKPRDNPPGIAQHNLYKRRVIGAVNEETMIHVVDRNLLRQSDNPGYRSSIYHAFTRLPPNVGFNNDFPLVQPSYVEGLEMIEFDPFPVVSKINGAVLYKDVLSLITLPLLAGMCKARGGGRPRGSQGAGEL